MAEKEEKSPITPTLRVMKIGEEFTYPIQMMTSVRTVCTTYGLQWGKTFKTRIDREEVSEGLRTCPGCVLAECRLTPESLDCCWPLGTGRE